MPLPTTAQQRIGRSILERSVRNLASYTLLTQFGCLRMPRMQHHSCMPVDGHDTVIIESYTSYAVFVGCDASNCMSPLKLLERLMSPRKLLAAKLWTNLQGLMGRWVTMPVMSPLKLTQTATPSRVSSHVTCHHSN